MERLDMHSPDKVNENITKIGNLFPNCITDVVSRIIFFLIPELLRTQSRIKLTDSRIAVFSFFDPYAKSEAS